MFCKEEQDVEGGIFRNNNHYGDVGGELQDLVRAE